MDKNLSGAKHLYRTSGGDSFRQAWKAAMALGASRKRAERAAATRHPDDVPGVTRRKSGQVDEGLPGQVRNEHGEWEDEASFRRRGEEANESIATKLLRIRRIFLQEISRSPGKRAAFEILTELAVDWDVAARGGAQLDEPYNIANMRQPDMVLLNESGWSFGDIGYGPKRMAEARRAIDAYRADHDLPAIDWEGDSTERSDAGV